ncbi:MAG: hypothetical protein H8E55_72830 [Pelagibacterales bacterium]|nr:hypothetical protein [Pelagibacterales bacterium]
MMTTHRRSDRCPKNDTIKDEVEARVQAFIKANRVEQVPGKVWRRENEEKDEIQLLQSTGFEYDKEMYLANDRYSTLVDRELAKFIKEKLWNEAVKSYEQDAGKHFDQFKDNQPEKHPYA